MSRSLRLAGLGLSIISLLSAITLKSARAADPDERPNILFLIADDWSYPHARAYGDAQARTPAFDRIASEGVLFDRAYCASPSCTPSRGAILTGQAVHRLENAGNLWSILPAQVRHLPRSPRKRRLHNRPHRQGLGPRLARRHGTRPKPRRTLLQELRRFSQNRARRRSLLLLVRQLRPPPPLRQRRGPRSRLRPRQGRPSPPTGPMTPSSATTSSTTTPKSSRSTTRSPRSWKRSKPPGEPTIPWWSSPSDNGMPFPRCKANLYDDGTRMPLAIRWPAQVKPGQTCDSFVSFTDFAPTFLEAAGLPITPEITGRSLIPLLKGQTQPHRDAVITERERHANVRKGDLSYPSRSIRTRDYSLILNLRPDRWPAGDPEKWVSVGPFGDVDGSPTKDFILDHARTRRRTASSNLNFAKRPAVEFYDLNADPDEINNLAGKPRIRRASSTT